MGSNSEDLGSGSGSVVLSRPVRAAIRFIRENARSHIRLQDIAAASVLTPRGLQAAFQREVDVSPMEYLRSVRLEGVHRDLRNAEPGQRLTVAEVARRWRFSNVGRMATAYRSVYGIAPSTTLRFLSGEDMDGRTAPVDVAGVAREDRPHFRLVLDCEVEIDDADVMRASIDEQLDQGQRAWPGYRPSGGVDDLVAFVLGRALRRAASDVEGITLRSVNPMVRVPDPQGDYPSAELPSWAGAAPDEHLDGDHEASDPLEETA
ncbi:MULTISPECIES: helix-turn-helix transcriptional regulator [unclassified Curtobacterium]|uniref:helix-turn-helix transcriptional regulator n=1 Tax=unclassified Curtobacterium TaxID=257496 RepID=UPI000DA9ADFF|nr:MULTISPECIES: helix-turn-helix transcriptional regulator [unclassified Curtobacterium]PZE24168.1 hypothetical protein DEI86_12950 [Curtobacterium sp. MCBD17_028]PZE73376.1 hypothetical protein DEI82_14420 [Curtobacterium sp. MCBD17_019]WIB67327.1 helix-turn-helix transcriptional regulator [Curtobacterium sp. MCBD17_035]